MRRLLYHIMLTPGGENQTSKALHHIHSGNARGHPPNNADLFSQLYEVVATLPITAKILWVRSHQDTTRKANSSLFTSAHLNIRADNLATASLAKHPWGHPGFPHSQSPHFPLMTVSILIGKTRIHSSTSHDCMRTSIQEVCLKSTFSTNTNWE